MLTIRTEKSYRSAKIDHTLHCGEVCLAYLRAQDLDTVKDTVRAEPLFDKIMIKPGQWVFSQGANPIQNALLEELLIRLVKSEAYVYFSMGANMFLRDRGYTLAVSPVKHVSPPRDRGVPISTGVMKDGKWLNGEKLSKDVTDRM